MKKILISFIFIAAYAICPAQEYSIPELTSAQKHSRMLYINHNFIISTIATAKNAGVSIEDNASFVSDYVKTTWDKEAGFEGFVKGTIYNWENFRRESDPPMEIEQQTDNQITVKYKNNFMELFEKGDIFNVSYDEFMDWMIIMHRRIGEYLGGNFEMRKTKDGWLYLVITRIE